ncbi:hypothetical protein ACTOV4_02680 [Brucella sp. C7-11G]
MDFANTPEQGTGAVSEMDTQSAFKNLLDSDNATTEVDKDAEAEALVASNTSDEDIDENLEQPETDSEEVDVDETDDAADTEAETPVERDPEEIVFEIEGQAISRKDAERGFLRQSDYTRKMQELAEHRKKWIVQEIDMHQVRNESANMLHQLAHHVAQVFQMDDFGAEPDWAAEFEIDPYTTQQKRYQWEKDKAAWQAKQNDREAAVRAIYDTQVKIAERDAQFAAAKREQDIIDSRSELARRMPDVFGDDKKANVALIELGNFLGEQGIPVEQVNELTDPTMIQLAYYAKLGMEAAKNMPKAVKKIEAKPALTMPGSTASKKPATGFNAKLKEYAGSNSKQGLFKHLLDNE